MKRTKKKIMDELAEAFHERDYLEYSKIPSLQKELKMYKLSKREKEEFEIYE